MEVVSINLVTMLCFILGFMSIFCTANNLDLQSPCPEFFQYKYDEKLGIYYGYLEIPPKPLGTTMHTIVNLTLGKQLVGRYKGSISTISSHANVSREIARGHTVKYRVTFPSQQPLPRLTSIISNNQVICTGQGDTGPVVTALKLNHQLHTARYAYQLALAARGLIKNVRDSPSPAPASEPRVNLPDLNSFSSSLFEQNSSPTFANDPVCGKGLQHLNKLVINGKKTKRGEFPWTAALFITQDNGLQFHCGGTLISGNLIVTAAHCIKDENDDQIPPNKFVVLLGKSDLHDWSEDKIVTVGVEEITPHPDYQKSDLSNFDADIAMVRLKKQIPYSKFIKPICLWEGDDDVRKIVSKKGTVVGWGKNRRTTPTSKPLLGIELEIVSESVCLRSDPAFQFMTSNRTFCAGNIDGSGPCNGDSGGPLMIELNGRWYFRGIISTSLLDPKTRSCDLDKYVVFTDVAKFQPWVLQFLDT